MFPIFIHIIDDRDAHSGAGILFLALFGLAAAAAAVFGVVFLIFGFPATVMLPLAYLVSGLLFPGVLSLSLVQLSVCFAVILIGVMLLLSALPRWVGAGLCGLGAFQSVTWMELEPGPWAIAFLILIAVGFSTWGFILATVIGRLPGLRILRALSRSRAANLICPPLVAVGVVALLHALNLFGPPSAQTVSPLIRDMWLAGLVLAWLLLVGGVAWLAQRRSAALPRYGVRRRA